LGAGRLYLAQAEIEAEQSHWADVSSLCRKAATAASDAQPSSSDQALTVAQVELAASTTAIRASLAQNRDAEAFQLAQQSVEIARKSFASTVREDRRWQALVLANGSAALVQHAAGEMEAASESFEMMMSLAEQADKPIKSPDYLVAPALKQMAAFRLAQGRSREAITLAARATNAAVNAAEAAAAEPTSPLTSPWSIGETLVDARLQLGAAAAEAGDWEDAEAHLGEALETAEAMGIGTGTAHPRIAFVLLPLAGIYSRTGRVTLAEGLYRKSINLLHLDIGSSEPAAALKAHTSVGALAAWRYAQLLTALPKRSTEAAAWHKLAADLYDDAPLRRVLEPASVFGTLDNLQGKGTRGTGAVLDLMSRRALPKMSEVAATME
jgi:tetratricopeptide (TPR) repeat protein